VYLAGLDWMEIWSRIRGMRKKVPRIALGIAGLLLSMTLAAGYLTNRRSQEEMKKAQELAAAGRTEEAIGAYQKVIEKYPDSDYLSQAWLESGKLQYQKQSYDQAAKSFEHARKDPEDKAQFLEASLWLGRSCYQLKKYQKVIEALEGIAEQIRDSGSKAEIYHLLYQSHLELRNYQNAVLWLSKYADFMSAKEIEKARASVPDWLSLLKDSELEEVFNRPGPEWIQGEAGYLLGLRYYQSNRLKEAKEVFEKLLARYPNTAHQDEIGGLIEQSGQLLEVVSTRIGLILPMSGTYQAFGDRALKGSLLAAGIFQYPNSGHKFELRVEDSFGDPEIAREKARRMILDDHIIALVGPILNPVAASVAEVSEQLNVPMIALNPNPGLTANKTHIFRNCMTKNSQIKTLLDWAMGEKQFSKFAVIYPEDKYGTEFAQIFSAEVQARGAELVKSVSYSAEETDFREVIGELEPKALSKGKEEKRQSLPLSFQALFIADSYEKIGIIVPQLLFYRVKPQFMGTSSWHSEKIFEHCRENYLENAVFADLYAPELISKDFDDYRFKYQQAFQEEPSLFDLQAYETTALLIDLIEKNKISNRRELGEALKSVQNWPGPLGLVSVNGSGEFEHQLHLFQIEKGKFIVVH